MIIYKTNMLLMLLVYKDNNNSNNWAEFVGLI